MISEKEGDKARAKAAGALIALAGCVCCGSETAPGDQPPDCSASTSRALEAEESTPVGTPKERQQALSVARTSILTWRDFETEDADASTSDLEIEPNLELSTAKYVTPASAVCDEYMTIGASLTFETSDGVFMERFEGEVKIDKDRLGVRFTGAFPAKDKRGSYNDATLLSHYTDATYTIYAGLETGDEGEFLLSGKAANPDGNPPTVASVGTIGPLE